MPFFLREPEALDAAPLSRRERRQSLAAAISCCAVFGITVAVMSPLISLILEGRGVDRTTIGAMASVPALALMATNPFLPTIVGRLGLRPFIYGCIVLQLVLTLLMPLFDNLIAWFVLRGLMDADHFHKFTCPLPGLFLGKTEVHRAFHNGGTDGQARIE